MTTRRDLLIALGAALAVPSSFAQQQGKVWRVGFLGSTSATGWADRVQALRAGFREAGYVEGKNLTIEYRWAEGKYERLPELAAELVRLKVDVLVTHGTPGTRAAKEATATMPIVMANAGDAVATGLVASIARPGGNITGSTFFNPEISAKRVEVLKEILPRARRVAVLFNPDNPAMGPNVRAMETTAAALKIELQRFVARGPDEFESAFSAMAAGRIDALAVNEDAMLVVNGRTIAALAVRHKLPLAGSPDFAQAGGLVAYGVNIPAMHHRVAYFADKIFKGAKPAELPVEQAAKFELVLNMTTAKVLGVKFPQAILVRADRVIE